MIGCWVTTDDHLLDMTSMIFHNLSAGNQNSTSLSINELFLCEVFLVKLDDMDVYINILVEFSLV